MIEARWAPPTFVLKQLRPMVGGAHPIRLRKIMPVVCPTTCLAILLGFSAGAPTPLPNGDRGPTRSVATQIDAALLPLPHASAVAGVCIVDLATGGIVYERNADRPLIPASNMKVFVMATALSVLGPAFEFETVLATDGRNLVLIGDGDPATGDPKLCHQRGETRTTEFERWAGVLRNRGERMVSGDILIDDSLFDQERINSTWEASDLGKWYAAPVGAINFNDNCVDITVRPGESPAAFAIVSVIPEGARVHITNTCKTGGSKKPILHHPPGTLEYKVSGTCRKRWPFGAVSFPDPGLLTGESLRAVLVQNGIRVHGGIRRGRVRKPDGSIPDTLTVVGRSRTPIADILKRIGKNSQNLFAECLLKRIGYEWARARGTAEPQGSWESGARAVLATLQAKGIDTTALAMSDGSGLSRENRCTARQLTSVLAWIDRQTYGSMFRESLSIAGTDGSLRKRLKKMPGIVLGKTGTMRGIRTLSGYITTRAGSRRYAFAILFNSYKGPSTPYKKIQDQICRILARATASNANTQ